jgi:hypothetical protein
VNEGDSTGDRQGAQRFQPCHAASVKHRGCRFDVVCCGNERLGDLGSEGLQRHELRHGDLDPWDRDNVGLWVEGALGLRKEDVWRI